MVRTFFDRRSIIEIVIFHIIFIGVLLSGNVHATEIKPLMVTDRLYFYDPEDKFENAGLSISGKFNSEELLTAAFRLDAIIGNFRERKWTLRDILVDADFNCNGSAATWNVSVPKPIIEGYLKYLSEGYKKKTLFYDFSFNRLDYRPTAYFEKEEAVTDPVEIFLRSEKIKYFIGEKVLLTVDIRNNTRRDIVLVKPQGGSERGWRYPFCVFSVNCSSSESREDIHVPACKTVDPLSTEAFFVVPSGRTVPLYAGGYEMNRDFKLDKPGVYSVIFRYSTVAAGEWQWYGAYTAEYWKDRNSNEFWKKREKEILKNRDELKKVFRIDTRTEGIQFELIRKQCGKDEALKIAETICIENNWKWKDVRINDAGESWQVMTNSMSLGMNAIIRIEKSTCKVLSKFFTGP
jgi:hypothetical protein